MLRKFFKKKTESSEMVLFDHLNEIRYRLIFLSILFIIFFIISFFNAKYIYLFLTYPLQKLSQNNSVTFIYTALQEAFLTYIKLAFFTSIFLILPFVFNQVWRFIATGLYAKEKRNFRIIFIISPLLFWLGAVIAYLWVIPATWKFFLRFETKSFNKNISINLLPKVNEYLSLSLHLIISFALSFLLPVVIFILVKINILSLEKVKKYRRYVVVIAFIIAAIATPPDPFSQIIMALVLILLYEFSIILVKFSNK